MSGWDVVSTVVGGVIGTLVAGPIGGIIGASAGMLGGTDAPERLEQKGPPYPGTVPEIPPYAPAPPGPPPGNPPGQGEADDAAAVDATQIAAAIEELTQLDQKAADAVAAIEAAGEQGRKALDDVAKSVEAKVTELGPRLNTPQGQQELRDFLKEKLTAAKQVLDEQNQIALDRAREIQEIAERFNQVGKPPDSVGAQPASDTGGGGSESGGAAPAPVSDSATLPATSTDPASTTPQGAPAGISPMMPGMGGMMPGMGGMMPAMPSFGGGMPGGGIGDPLSALSGLGGGPPSDEGLKLQDPAAEADPLTADAKLNDPGVPADSAAAQDPAGLDEPEPAADITQPASTAPADNPGGADPGVTDASTTAGGDKPTDVKLPDGTTAHAPSEQAATALRAALNGASVSDAYQQAGITLPPAGSPVLDPVAPGKLLAGDVGMWKDHMVMALGDGKVLVSGQVQPQSSVGSGPDFLGWMRPATGADTAGATPPPPSGPQAPPPPAQT